MSQDWHSNRMYDSQCLVADTLIHTELDPNLFRACMGRPDPGWTSNTFGYQGAEWAWQFQNSKELVKAAVVKNKVIFAVSSVESYYKFLAFVIERFGQPAK